MLIAAIAFLRTRDVFMMSHVVKVINYYILPLFLVGSIIQEFSRSSFAKVVIFIILNIIISNLLCYTVLNKASSNKIAAKAELKNL